MMRVDFRGVLPDRPGDGVFARRTRPRRRDAEHRLHPGRRPGLRRPRLLQPGLEDPHAEPRPAGDEGMRFTDAHAPSAVCTPTRYAHADRPVLLAVAAQAGRPRAVGRAADRRRAGSPSPALLKQHGYATACIGKWHLGWTWPTKDGQAAAERPRSAEQRRLHPADRRRADHARLRPLLRHRRAELPALLLHRERPHRRASRPSPNRPEFNRPGPMLPGWQWVDILPELTRRAVGVHRGRRRGQRRRASRSSSTSR